VNLPTLPPIKQLNVLSPMSRTLQRNPRLFRDRFAILSFLSFPFPFLHQPANDVLLYSWIKTFNSYFLILNSSAVQEKQDRLRLSLQVHSKLSSISSHPPLLGCPHCPKSESTSTSNQINVARILFDLRTLHLQI